MARSFTNDMFFTLSGVLFLGAMLLPHIAHVKGRAYQDGHYSGYRVGMRAGLLYADQLMQDGWVCAATAYITRDGERLGIGCTNGSLNKLMANEAEAM